MQVKNFVSCLLFSLLCLNMLSAQGQDSKSTRACPTCEEPKDELYSRSLYKDKKALDYDFIHEKDVMWEKRIWREISVKNKRNQYFHYAKKGGSLVEILLDMIYKHEIIAYSTMDDEFKTPISYVDATNLGRDVDTVAIYDPATFEETITFVENDFNPADVSKYRIKEVWFFDEETGSMGVRILGIAPIVTRYDDNGNFLNEGAMFWVYYPTLRQKLANIETFNPENDALRMTWDDVFEARLFESYITKESNVHDRRIKDYKSGVDALVEGEKIKEEIRNREADMWEH
jgi:gliding motility associated protien GldN